MRSLITIRGAYVYAMPASQAVRRAAWAQFVRRASANAEARGLSVPRLAELAGISNSTIYRWLHSTGMRMPGPEQVAAFCKAAGIDPMRAFEILWLDNHPQPTDPAPLDPELEAIARKLADPRLPESERYYLRETIRQLAARPVTPVSSRPVRRRRSA
jgi:transcriptional regulator with XRE-family HTH domain